MSFSSSTSNEKPFRGKTKCGFVAIAGAPNAGKSTLLNRMVGSKLSIVSHKVQTTRMQVRGVAIHENAQLILVDTPGIFAPRRELDEAMVEAAWEGVREAELRLLLVDAAAFKDRTNEATAKKANSRAIADTLAIVETLRAQKLDTILVLNKVDKVAKEHLLESATFLNDQIAFRETFMVSAETGDGVADLLEYAAKHVPEGPWLYPEDQLSDLPLRLMAAEITREKLILRLHDELPYASTVETESWQDVKKGGVRIEQIIYVERDTQKAIVLGKRGQTIKEIGSQAREEMMDAFGFKVHLFLTVKVKPKWAKDPDRFAAMGLPPAKH